MPRRLLAPLLALPLGCYGGLDPQSSASGADDSATGDDSADDGDAGDSGSDDGSSGDSDTSPGASSDCHGFDSGLRRLNLREYERALQALLGEGVEIGAGFPADDTASGFDIDAGLLPVSDVWLAAHASVAEEAVTAALAAGSPRRAEIVTCAGEDDACAEEILGAFGLAAWRRPVGDDEMLSLLALLEVAEAEGEGFEAGLSLALQAVLVSPNFVFKVETDRDEDEAVDGYELATRLAFFLWSAPPDDELLAAAAAGELDDADALREHIDRMLSDPRADALTEGFAAQWLELSQLDGFAPLPGTFAGWDESLRDAMAAETKGTFQDALANDLTAAELVASPQVLVNETLAEHYGIPGVTGDELQWVDGTSVGRHGLLTQGSILTLSSHPNQSSPTRRGLWVTDRLLCTPPPPPPADVDNTVPEPGASEWETIREFLTDVHLLDATCASCHSVLDPVGFALENYDGVGAFRDAYANGVPIDSSGAVAGQAVAGPAELSTMLAEHPDLQDCIAGFAVAYASNRGHRENDSCAVREAVGDEPVGLRTLLEEIVTHPSFAAPAAPEED